MKSIGFKELFIMQKCETRIISGLHCCDDGKPENSPLLGARFDNVLRGSNKIAAPLVIDITRCKANAFIRSYAS